MKKVISFVLMTMIAVSMNAQDITGKWMANDEFNDELNQSAGQEGVNFKLGLGIDNSTIKLSLYCNVEADGMQMVFYIGVPGVYERSGQHVTSTFDENGMELTILDLKSDDPELKEMLANEGTKTMLFAMLQDQMKEQSGELKAGINKMSETFKEFDVKSVSDTNLVIEVDGTDVNFVKK